MDAGRITDSSSTISDSSRLASEDSLLSTGVSLTIVPSSCDNDAGSIGVELLLAGFSTGLAVNGCKGSGTALDTATPTEQQGVKDATSSGAKPVRIGGQLLTPGAVGSLSSDSNQLPTPLIVLLAALGACALALAGVAGWNRVVARRAR